MEEFLTGQKEMERSLSYNFGIPLDHRRGELLRAERRGPLERLLAPVLGIGMDLTQAGASRAHLAGGYGPPLLQGRSGRDREGREQTGRHVGLPGTSAEEGFPESCRFAPALTPPAS